MAVRACVAGRNRILGALPEEEVERLSADLRLVELAHGRVLFRAHESIDDVYFPLSGACSIVATSASGESTDVVLVGNEGFVGLPVLLGTERIPMPAVIQLPGSAMQLSVRGFNRHMALGGMLPRLLLRYVQMQAVEMAQSILCNRIHSVHERSARWLLHLDERAGALAFELTHDLFATMLGTARPSISQALGEFRDEGLIDYSRGIMEVIEHDRLEAVSCECYRIVRDEHDRLLAV